MARKLNGLVLLVIFIFFIVLVEASEDGSEKNLTGDESNNTIGIIPSIDVVNTSSVSDNVDVTLVNKSSSSVTASFGVYLQIVS